jgi:hypothetical protein
MVNKFIPGKDIGCRTQSGTAPKTDIKKAMHIAGCIALLSMNKRIRHMIRVKKSFRTTKTNGIATSQKTNTFLPRSVKKAFLLRRAAANIEQAANIDSFIAKIIIQASKSHK